MALQASKHALEPAWLESVFKTGPLAAKNFAFR
jgi:hypothetical protein